MTQTSRELHLQNPQTLYRRWEDAQWNPFGIDLSADASQWAGMTAEDRSTQASTAPQSPTALGQPRWFFGMLAEVKASAADTGGQYSPRMRFRRTASAARPKSTSSHHSATSSS